MIFQNCIFGLLLFLCYVEAQNLNKTYLISGGESVDRQDLAKYAVSIQLREDNEEDKLGFYHFCGGAILTPRKILTAAHCLWKSENELYRPSELIVVIGSTNRFIHAPSTRVKEVAFVKSHNAFRRGDTLYGDVGILTLKEEIYLNNRHVALVKTSVEHPRERDLCTVLGWGRLYDDGPAPDRILFAEVIIQNSQKCKLIYGAMFTDGMFCCSYPEDWERDSCSGDSGGPLICNDVLVGVVSWGIECGSRNLPGVYTDVAYYQDWIAKGPRMVANYFVVIFLTTIALNNDFICQRSWGS